MHTCPADGYQDRMTAYRRLWWCASTVVWVAACFIAAATVPASALVTISAFIGVSAGAFSIAAGVDDLSCERVDCAVRHGVVAAAATVAALGLIAGAGGVGLLVAATFAGTSPPVVRRAYEQVRRRRWERALDAADEERLAVQPGTTPVSELSTPDLVLAWRISFNALRQAQNATAASRIVDRRRRYLDELERRDPAGVRRWLESGTRAASDPTRFLLSDSGSESDETGEGRSA